MLSSSRRTGPFPLELSLPLGFTNSSLSLSLTTHSCTGWKEKSTVHNLHQPRRHSTLVNNSLQLCSPWQRRRSLLLPLRPSLAHTLTNPPSSTLTNDLNPPSPLPTTLPTPHLTLSTTGQRSRINGSSSTFITRKTHTRLVTCPHHPLPSPTRSILVPLPTTPKPTTRTRPAIPSNQRRPRPSLATRTLNLSPSHRLHSSLLHNRKGRVG